MVSHLLRFKTDEVRRLFYLPFFPDKRITARWKKQLFRHLETTSCRD